MFENVYIILMSVWKFYIKIISIWKCLYYFQENNSYFQEVRNNFSIFVFITQDDVKEPTICLHKLEQLKLCNLSYIREYEQKFRKYAILARVDGTPEYLNKYILKIQGPIGLGLWNEFTTSEYKNSPYIGARIEFVKNWLEKNCVSIGERSQIKKQDDQQLCRKLHRGENLDIGCKEYKFRKPKSCNKFLRRKSRTFYKKTTISNKI